MTKGADIVVVGSGVAGLLVARELVAAGRAVTVIERGGLKPHADQLRDGEHSLRVPTAEPNHESHPDTPELQLDYEFAVGGTALHWGGATPRLLPSDFELRSRYGVGRDWPFGYGELAPFYDEAERALAVAGATNTNIDPDWRAPLPAHPFSPADRLLSRPLAPYYALPQARPTRSVQGRPACCGSGKCGLCPVDARYSPLHTLGDHLDGRDGFELVSQTIVARLRRTGRAWRLDLIGADGERRVLGAQLVVLAAGGLETSAILMRSGLGGEEVGHWLGDARHDQYVFEFPRPVGGGRGSSISTGISYAWADGGFRSRRASHVVYPDNRGPFMGRELVYALSAGASGRRMRERLADRFSRSIVLETSAEELPERARRVELSPNRDRFGLPLNRVRYPAASRYLEAGRAALREGLEQRLGELGGRLVRQFRYGGGTTLGTCHMARDGGVVDPDGRVHGESSLYCAGGAAFPSYSAAHPTLTIAALAIRLGRTLAGTL